MTNVNRNLKPIVNKMPTKNQVVITKVQGQNKKIQLQLPPNFLLCPICGSYFTQKFRLDKHMAQVHEPKPQQNLVQTLYQCSVCNTCYKEKSELEFHSALAHGKGQYQCGDCSATFDTESDLMQHYSSVHEETSPAQLGHAQLDQAQLGHTQLGHAQSSHAQLGQAAQMRNVYVGPALIPGYTQTSQATGQTKRQVINIKVHEENKLFYCPHGCIGAKSKENLTEHLIEYHTNGRYQCNICKSRFHREEQLTAHTILEHRGIPKFQSLRTLNSIESVFTEPPKAVVHVNQSDIAKFKCHLWIPPNKVYTKLLDPTTVYLSSPPSPFWLNKSQRKVFCIHLRRILSLFSNYLRRRARVVRSFSRFMLICLSTAVCMYNGGGGGGGSAARWRRRSGGALPPCNFILAPSFGFLPARGIRPGGVYEDGWDLSHQLFKKNDLSFLEKWFLFPNFFWPTIRKNCSRDQEKLLKS